MHNQEKCNFEKSNQTQTNTEQSDNAQSDNTQSDNAHSMITLRIKPASLKGTIQVPSSKSMGHRAIICAGLSDEKSRIKGVSVSEDIWATIEAMKQFGAEIKYLNQIQTEIETEIETEKKANAVDEVNIETDSDSDSDADVEVDTDAFDFEISNPKMRAFYESGQKPIQPQQSQQSQQSLQSPQLLEIYCNESGSTARFLIPLFFLNAGTTLYTGTHRLSQRPYLPYYSIFNQQQIQYHASGTYQGLPLSLKGDLKPDLFEMRGDISSQFISGLMFALPLLSADSELVLTTPLESKNYVELTRQCLQQFGIKTDGFFIPGNQRYRGIDYVVEGDYSQAAFWLVANYLGADIELLGLDSDSLQADKEILNIIQMIETLRLTESENRMLDIDVSQFPDLVPILTVLLALTPGQWTISNAKRLRIKESDRLAAIATELNKLGASIQEREEGLEISGVLKLHGAKVEAWNDHRIAMALAIASLCCEGDVILQGANCTRKSYPKFWDHFKKLGGIIDVE